MNTHTQDDQPPQIKLRSRADVQKAAAQIAAYQQRLASQGNPDDPKLNEPLTKIEAVMERQLERQEQTDYLKHTIVTKYIREYCYYLFPNGRPAARGGYWEVPAPYSWKISYKTGFVWDWKKTMDRDPIRFPNGSYMDIINLWARAKDVNFTQAIRGIRRWIQEREQGISAPAPTGPPRRSDACNSDLKGCVFDAVFQNGKIKDRGNASYFLKKLRGHFGRNWDAVCRDTPEFMSAPRFLLLLMDWHENEDKEFFSVSYKRWANTRVDENGQEKTKVRISFLLKLTNSQEEPPIEFSIH